ncbi:hypothetical protein HWV62_31003 [Athelia sp. TMB]|nr:hypothetical protein HWV62_31003 [Athelia sp. TMB]
MMFDSLPGHLIPAPGQRILPPVIHYGYAAPLARLMELEIFSSMPTAPANPSTFYVARMVRHANQWLQENVFKAHVVIAPVVDDQVKFVFSMYTNYTVEERECRADVCSLDETLREWLGREAEARWYVDGEDWHWRWSTASR